MIFLWENKLKYQKAVLEVLANFQKRWTWLFKLFNLETAGQQLESLKQTFQKIDKEFLDFISKMSKKNSILEIFEDQTLLKKFENLEKEADFILKGTNPFINSLKDEVFRLHFISNEHFLDSFGEVSY